MKFCVGKEIEGFKLVRITDEELLECKNSKVVLYLDRESNDRLLDYYKAVRNILRSGNDLLVLLNEEETSNISQAITHLNLEYANYKIYKVYNDTVLDKEYISDMYKRKSSADEVQLYVSKEGEAYETITEALLSISEMCLDNKLNELQDYIINNKDLIKEYPAVLSYMKQNIDELNLGITIKLSSLEKELKRALEDKTEVEQVSVKLKESVDNLKNVVTQQEEDNKRIQHKLTKYEETLENLQKEKAVLEEQTKQLQSSVQSSGTVGFTSYTPLNMTQIKGNKVKRIIYIKEISKPRYINTLVTLLLYCLNTKGNTTKNKTKLLIFDSREDFANVYYPIQQVNTNTYFDVKTDILSQDKVVFTDTNPTYLSDIMTGGNTEYLIIYDRLGQQKDLVFGAAVIKFYTFASKNELVCFKKKYNDVDETRVIMNSPSGVVNTLEIQEVSGFNTIDSVQAKFTKYYKMRASMDNAQPLFEAILSKCGLSLKN